MRPDAGPRIGPWSGVAIAIATIQSCNAAAPWLRLHGYKSVTSCKYTIAKRYFRFLLRADAALAFCFRFCVGSFAFCSIIVVVAVHCLHAMRARAKGAAGFHGFQFWYRCNGRRLLRGSFNGEGGFPCGLNLCWSSRFQSRKPL